MQFPYAGHTINLLDTPGHQDFSEDTYRTLTAVDSALMVIDCAKGVKERTIKLMEVCRLRDTTILTFINKLDREGRDAMEVLDEIENVLQIQCAPVTWPIGMGKRFKGVFDLRSGKTHLFSPTHGGRIQEGEVIEGLENPRLDEVIGAHWILSTDSISSSSSIGGRPSRSSLLMKVRIGVSRRRQTLSSLMVCASTPFTESITMTAESTAVSVR